MTTLSTARSIFIFTTITLTLPACSLKFSTKGQPEYKGFIAAPLVSKKPLWMYYNDNHQLGLGRGYVLTEFPTHGDKVGKDGLIGVLPAGHPVTLDGAYWRYDFGLTTEWLEGRTDFNGAGYRIQMTVKEGGERSSVEPQQVFRPIQ